MSNFVVTYIKKRQNSCCNYNTEENCGVFNDIDEAINCIKKIQKKGRFYISPIDSSDNRPIYSVEFL